MSAKTVAAYVQCQAVNVPPYSGLDCIRVPHYEVIYRPSEIRVLRVRLVGNKAVSRSLFHVDPPLVGDADVT